MAIVRMRKMSIVSHKSERSKMLKLFLKSGAVEVSKTEEFDSATYRDDTDKRRFLESKLLRITFALEFIKERGKEMLALDKNNMPKLNFKRENRLVSIEEYENVSYEEIEIEAKIKDMELINANLVDYKSEKARLLALKDQFLVYKGLEVPFSSIADTKNTTMVVGTMPTPKVEEFSKNLPTQASFTSYHGDKLTCVVVIFHNLIKEEVLTHLVSYDFVKCSFDLEKLPCEKIFDIDTRLEELENLRVQNIKDSMRFSDFISKLKVAYDYYMLEIAKLDCMAKCPQTGKTFVMECWIPEDKEEEIKDALSKKCSKYEVVFSDPCEEEKPPTLLKANKVVTSFGGITEMFGAPNYRESDPNLFVALFYFMIFGIMISDAGYGLLMAIACFAFIKITKPVKNSGNMIIMFGFCGISTFIWGALFGGWFGVESAKLPQFLQSITWFNPLDDPLKMFMLALGVGLLHLGTGFAIEGVSEIRKKRVVEGILNYFSWDIIFVGIALMSPSLMSFLGAIKLDVVPTWFGLANKIGMYIALGGFILLVLGGAWGKKNPIKMLTGAFGSAYGAINVVSDVLSYSRLFGLGLTTGVIGYVINMLGDIIVNEFFGGLWVGWIVAIPILIGGHLFNLGINLLGAYVHNSRLQYIEFFGKFYEGDGKAFAPLGSKTKYTFVDN